MGDAGCTCVPRGPFVVYDTQIYLPKTFGGGGGGGDDSDSDWELTSGAHILCDSEPPSDSSSESDEAENKSMVVSKAVIAAKNSKKIKTRNVAGGRVSDASGGGSSWSEISTGFINYLAKAELPV